MRFAPLLFIAGLTIVCSAPSHGAPSESCGYTFLTMMDVYICRDPQIGALDRELDILNADALVGITAAERQSVEKARSLWSASRFEKCGISTGGFVWDEQLLTRRPCLVDLYVERIKSVGTEFAGRAENRLLHRPNQVTTANSHFVVLSTFPSFPLARSELGRLTAEFPFESFAIYPPYRDDKQWKVVFAAYMNQSDALAALALAEGLRITSSPKYWSLPNPAASDPTWQPAITFYASSQITRDSTASKVLGCYQASAAGGKRVTIQTMFDCAAVWVTPRALLRCALGAQCPVLRDTIEGRANLDALLKDEGLTRDGALELRATDIPPQPDAAQIRRCRESSASEAEFKECVVPTVPGSKYERVRSCFDKPDEGQRLSCLSDQVPDAKFKSLIGCVAGGMPSPDSLLNCSIDQSLKQQADNARHCASAAPNLVDALTCVSGGLTASQKDVADCVSTKSSASDAIACLDKLSPEIAKARQVAGCMSEKGPTNETSKVTCISNLLGGNTAQIAGCLQEQDRTAAAICLMGDKKEVRVAQRLYKCVSEVSDASALIANCTEGVLDAKTSQTLACVSRSGGDRAQLAGCAASAVLPPDAARLVGCATSSDRPTSFALCAAGSGMNEEWRIAAECAVQSGGNPVGFAGCTAGRLTIRELTKCFSGQIGTDCFGPNNTIVKYLNDEFNDLTHGPGRNNEIVKAIEAISQITGGPNSVVNNPGQLTGGPNSLINNPGQIFGGSGSVFNDPGQVLNRARWRF
jgi:hypothetical protein